MTGAVGAESDGPGAAGDGACAPPPSGGAGGPGEGLVVRGGAGGIAARLEHLRDGARSLRASADLLDDAAASTGWAEREGLGPVPGASVTLVRAQAALTPLVRGRRSLGAQAEAVRELSGALTRAADLLDRAEDAAGEAVRVLLAIGGQHAGATPLASVVGSVVLARAVVPGLLLVGAVLHASGRGPAVARWLRSSDPGEHAVQALAGFVRGLAPGTAPPSVRPVTGASALLTAVTVVAGTAAPELARRPLTVTARLGGPGGGPPPRASADLLARVGSMYPRSGGTAGTVGVDRLDHPDGRRTWVVSIPGTQEATSFGASPNPMDMATNVRLMATWVDDSTELVARAMEQAGARPGEEVLLAGHSQGGMAAVALARSAPFTARYRVAAVLTAGSPVATQGVPRGAVALHLEHRQDLVPALDGWRNPDRPNRTTAVRDLAASADPVDRLAARSPGAAHGVDAYVRTARDVSGSGHTSVREWERAAASVLGGATVTVVRREFTGERAAVPPRARVVAPGPWRGDRPDRPGATGRLSDVRGSPR